MKKSNDYKDNSPDQNKSKKRGKLLLGMTIVLIFFFFAFDVRLKTVHYSVFSEKITKPTRIALVTDLHSCDYGENQKELVDAVENQKPDIVLLGGNIFDDEIPDKNTEEFLKAIQGKYPTYYVTGNHEYWSRRVDEMIKTLKNYDVEILDGKTKVIEMNQQKINFSGVDDPDAEYYTDKGEIFYSQLDAIEKVKDKKLFSILLAHRPSYVKSYLEYDFDLVLSGHAHVGQWRIPFLLNGVYAPDEEWFPQYAGGQYQFENGQMIVSRGLSRESTRVPRIFNRPGLVIVDIKAKE